MPDYLTTSTSRRLAYHLTEGTHPMVVFLGGLRSDMAGTKAMFLEDWAKSRGRAFLRFDYSGHGDSSGAFSEGCIGDWAEDAAEILDRLAPKRVVLVGSSMGGWISLLMARRSPERIAGLMGIAAAPDFTEDGFWANFSEDQRAQVMGQGQTALPSEYGEPMIVTKRMIEDGRENLVLRSPLAIEAPVRLLQGTADEAVDQAVALRLLAHLRCDDLHLELVKGEDHRFSSPHCLDLLARRLDELLEAAA
ncbi:alpha/beta hydrolase [Rhodobacteraceae bacterium XHP0102]|nr:alpha/beta hydrolase [Rhodobacteraceae bacterium XHP0102]